MAETHKGFGLLFEMGCGKTLTAIMIAGAAYQMGKVEKVLVVAPTSVCSVWPKDFAEFADFKANIKVLLGDKNRRLKLLNADDHVCVPFIQCVKGSRYQLRIHMERRHL